MSLVKIWSKFINRKKYQELRYIEARQHDDLLFKTKHEKEIDLIHKKIKNQKKINFLHSGHAADIINVLPVIKELSKSHECNLYLNINKPIKFYYKHPAGKFYMNEKIFEMLLPLLRFQNYLNIIEKYDGQDIDVSFDLFRELPVNHLFDNAKYASVVTGIQPDLTNSFLNADEHKELKKKNYYSKNI